MENKEKKNYEITQEEGRNEITYQMTMSAARKMLQQALITKEDYANFESKMIKKYSPKFSQLFSDISLI